MPSPRAPKGLLRTYIQLLALGLHGRYQPFTCLLVSALIFSVKKRTRSEVDNDRSRVRVLSLYNDFFHYFQNSASKIVPVNQLE